MLIHLTNGALFYAAGKVVHGFGRGSKQLGIPTANLEEFIVDQIPDSVKNGIYFGWAKLNNTPVYKMVMSIGWNPYFKNAKRSMEVHILHHFEENFYGDTIKLIAVKFSRPELDFPSITDLIKQIHIDISEANSFLNKSEAVFWSKHEYFSENTY
ncbi:Riboflavin kinase [Schistosoma japonicum]|nr:Riboflavin kinase [Schistosoma japonicum]KAH8857964.1 Riboflavin kinase [Schistosoma japonicum]KAH8857970.1 Riboflavin kinase [Schistosoma japonicum]